MRPSALQAPVAPRAHALSLAESLRGPRAVRPDARRVGLDPLLRSQLNTMGASIDGLLRRDDRIEPLYDAPRHEARLADTDRQLQLLYGPQRRVAEPAYTDPLVGPVLEDLRDEDFSPSRAVDLLESELRSPAVRLQSPGESGALGFQGALRGDSTPSRSVRECERCSVMGVQVRALAQSLAGLGARIFNWSSDMQAVRRKDLAEVVLGYAQPCAHIDEAIQNLCDELTSIEWEGAAQGQTRSGALLDEEAYERSSATWAWWDLDPQAMEQEAADQRAAKDHKLAREEQRRQRILEKEIRGQAPDEEVNLDDVWQKVDVSVEVQGGSGGFATLQVYIYDETLPEVPAVIAGEERIDLLPSKKPQTFELWIDPTTTQEGYRFLEMEQPFLAVAVDEEEGSLTYASDVEELQALYGVSPGTTVTMKLKPKR